MKPTQNSLRFRWQSLAVMACLVASSGCTSVISSAYLRDAWLDAVDHASEPEPDTDDTAATRGPTADGTGTAESDRDASDAASEPAAADALSPASLEEAAAEADRRLARSGGLSDAARSALVSTLKTAPRQDWPVVIEEFTAALASAQAAAVPTTAAPAPALAAEGSTAPSAAGDAGPAIAAPAPAVAALPPAATAPAIAPSAEPLAPLPPAVPDQTAADPSATTPPTGDRPRPAFSVQNACFASRVRGWGVVDRFEASTFRPGQELIVYFELDQLDARQSADGHTTRIDTALRIVGDDGSRVHEWTFEPLEETCGSQRRDYFARYLVTLPESLPPGPCRLEVVVSDAIAGRTAQTSLPLEIAPR